MYICNPVRYSRKFEQAGAKIVGTKNRCLDELEKCANVKNHKVCEAKAGTVPDVLSDCYAKGRMTFGLILFFSPQ